MELPQKTADIEEKRIGDELYLYGKEGEQLTVLNSTAMLIWSLCDGTHSADDMVTVLADIMSGVDQQELSGDIRETLAMLKDQQLIA